MSNLNIYFKKELIGTIHYNIKDDIFTFEYTSSWKEKGFELTPKMKFDNTINSNTIKRFLENLLPEGIGREVLSINFQISKNNIFGLIKAIGHETTGALTFNETKEEINTFFREVSEEELANRIKERKNTPISIWDEKPRLSIAGVQDKLPISIIEGKYGFGEGSLASTHILKFEKDEDNIVLNEYLSLKLASKTGLNTAEANIIKIKDQEVLLVKRFDREEVNSQTINRIHIIDACQALDLSVIQKYERSFGKAKSVENYREGASFKKLFSLIALCDSPILAKKEIITWICTNLCLGNSDAHGKNISFVINKNSMKLSPFYDIVNISVYKYRYDTDLAMAIDDIFSFEELGSYDFIEFCKNLNINLRGFVKEFTRVSNVIEKNLNENLIADLDTKKKRIFFDEYKDDILTRIVRLRNILNYCLEYEG
ncbi:MAG: hypothetical protein C0625_10270 [Arcobacter sp.]|nr:MAG: hypothetical protein C0625_10270 [Arcobacter sp.]